MIFIQNVQDPLSWDPEKGTKPGGFTPHNQAAQSEALRMQQQEKITFYEAMQARIGYGTRPYKGSPASIRMQRNLDAAKATPLVYAKFAKEKVDSDEESDGFDSDDANQHHEGDTSTDRDVDTSTEELTEAEVEKLADELAAKAMEPKPNTANMMELQHEYGFTTVKARKGKLVWVPMDIKRDKRYDWASNISCINYKPENINDETVHIPRFIAVPGRSVELTTDQGTAAASSTDTNQETTEAGRDPAGILATGAPRAAKRKVSFGPTREEPEEVWTVHQPQGSYKVDVGSNNYQLVDSLPDSEVKIAYNLMQANIEGAEEIHRPRPENDTTDRPQFARGSPDYACPAYECESPRESRCNFLPTYPAGTRLGNQKLPDQYGDFNQKKYEIGSCVDQRALDGDKDRLYRRANAADNFVVTGPVSCLKGVRMSYLKTTYKRYT